MSLREKLGSGVDGQQSAYFENTAKGTVEQITYSTGLLERYISELPRVCLGVASKPASRLRVDSKLTPS